MGLLTSPGALGASDRAELVADLDEEVETMTTLVSEMLELAHGEEAALKRRRFRLDELVQSAVDRAAKRERAIFFRSTLAPTSVFGAPERIERAVDNLLDNARKWSPVGGAVDISVRDGVLEVRDHGPGIAPADVPFVFDRFYRSVQAHAMHGAGLGLAIVKQVADAHNGTVSVTTAPGGGAVFRLDFSDSLVADES